ncbi:MAG TPA: calcium/sodium antiporter [Deltaproteobacteria bacterium]|nr:calcium/sodium antiporter [Deltaproteobacteria bacterium]OQC29525.1 MAG: Inner membrane protein YrbG [Deltaproteobacteria bacterium ADurb.Bin072]HRW81037.1 calcium/sodium antiporter [Desulfomonilia bacterium]NMD41137.1 calcium/sodium antiporter [Deltaproteobacteria bacterium]HNQ84472.1 calcium/sodium antiporter [Deltaproteobacteria bacterium]
MLSCSLLLAAGLAMLLGGGNLLVRGASGIARSLNVSPLVIGLTVVAFGTSAPELVVNIAALIRGNDGLAFGNVIGSNISNTGLILGLTALVSPLRVTGMVIVREIPMMILVALVAVITGIDGVFTAAADSFSRPDGLILLLLLVVFIFYNVKDALRRRSEEEYLVQVEEHIPSRPKESMSIGGIMVLAGLGLLAAGGKLAVTGAVGLASALGVSDALIGLTVIAVGTSLPELATSMIAALKNEPELAVGNVVGSNIINLSLILGLVCTVSPVDVPAGGRLDLVAMLLFSLILLPVSLTSRRKITRIEGAALLSGYCAYVVVRALCAG